MVKEWKILKLCPSYTWTRLFANVSFSPQLQTKPMSKFLTIAAHQARTCTSTSFSSKVCRNQPKPLRSQPKPYQQVPNIRSTYQRPQNMKWNANTQNRRVELLQKLTVAKLEFLMLMVPEQICALSLVCSFTGCCCNQAIDWFPFRKIL